MISITKLIESIGCIPDALEKELLKKETNTNETKKLHRTKINLY
jgi:hypothetical protein